MVSDHDCIETEGLSVYTGHWINDGQIYSPLANTGYLIRGNRFHGPGGDTGYWVDGDDIVFGPDG